MSSSGFTFTRVKDQMIQELLDMGIKDFRVLDSLSQVPRHIFLDQALWSRAYENRALTIGYKQTISQPYIVARMTEHLIAHTTKRGKVGETKILLNLKTGTNMDYLPRYSVINSPERFVEIAWESVRNRQLALGETAANAATIANSTLFANAGTFDPNYNIDE